jgi:hypothetical protein
MGTLKLFITDSSRLDDESMFSHFAEQLGGFAITN